MTYYSYRRERARNERRARIEHILVCTCLAFSSATCIFIMVQTARGRL